MIESGQKKVFFETFLSKMVFWRCYRGQIPIFLWATPTFFPLKRFLNRFIITPEKRSGPFRWKYGDLTPKHVFKGPFFFISVFGVKCPFFDGWHSFFCLWIIFLTCLKEFQRKKDIFLRTNAHFFFQNVPFSLEFL